jgi:hypothetical protein
MSDWVQSFFETKPFSRLTCQSLFIQNDALMGNTFSPTPKDVERYRRLRAIAMDLHEKIMRTIPRQTLNEVGKVLGILHENTFVFDSMDMSSVLMDCCLYDWFEEGKNIVQKYAEAHPPKPGTDMGYLLEAYLHAKYGVLVMQSVVPGAGAHCRDVLNNRELFLMDLGLSQTAQDARVAFATRTIPLGEYWMTSGAALPISPRKGALDALGRVAAERSKSPEEVGSVALWIVRLALAAGAADHVAYADVVEEPGEPQPRPRHRPLPRRRPRHL